MAADAGFLSPYCPDKELFLKTGLEYILYQEGDGPPPPPVPPETETD